MSSSILNSWVIQLLGPHFTSTNIVLASRGFWSIKVTAVAHQSRVQDARGILAKLILKAVHAACPLQIFPTVPKMMA